MLIPSSYYEATILLQKVNNPCEINGKGLCRHFGYPNIDGFDSAHGSNGQFSKDNQQYNINKFIDSTQVRIIIINYQSRSWGDGAAEKLKHKLLQL